MHYPGLGVPVPHIPKTSLGDQATGVNLGQGDLVVQRPLFEPGVLDKDVNELLFILAGYPGLVVKAAAFNLGHREHFCHPIVVPGPILVVKDNRHIRLSRAQWGHHFGPTDRVGRHQRYPLFPEIPFFHADVGGAIRADGQVA